MARWATNIKIAGVDFTGCRAEILDGAGFQSAYAGSVDWANDAKPHTQVFNRGVKGIPFGIKFVSTDISRLQSTLAAIATAQGTNTTVVVELTEGIYTIKVNAVPDYSQTWLIHGKHSEGWYEDVAFRFVSVTDAS